MTQLTPLQEYIEELDAGNILFAEATESSLRDIGLSEREKAIILSGQESVVRSVAAGEVPIEDVRLQLSAELFR